MSLNLFDTDVQNSFSVPSHQTASILRTGNDIRSALQEYQTEYANNLNQTIIQMFTKIINSYNQFVIMTRQINQNLPNLTQTVNAYNALDEEAKRDMDRNRNIIKILVMSKLKVWLILFATEQLEKQNEFLDDIVILNHLTISSYANTNNTNDILGNLIPQINILINDYNSYIEQSNNFRVSLNQRISNGGTNLGQTVRNIERSFNAEYEELKNKFTEFQERLYGYTNILHEQMRIIYANMPPPIENPEVMSGPAWEVHNYFKSLNMPRIEEIMTQYNASHQQNPNTIDPQSTNNSLFKPLLIFIQKSDLFPEAKKSEYSSKLQFIVDYIADNDDSDDLERLKHIIDIALEFVIKHDDDYISEYIRSYIDSCLNAYSNNGVSCVAGMIERIVTENGIIIKALCLEGCDEVNQELNALFNKTLNDVIQEWSNTFLEGGPQENVLENMTVEQRKQHLIDFIKNSYNNIIDSNLALKISEEINKYETMGVFQNLHYGEKKKKRTNKKKTNKRKTNKRKTNKKKTNKKRTNKKKN